MVRLARWSRRRGSIRVATAVATVTQAQQKRFVGRRQELAAIDATLDGLRGGRARWLVVSGEPGIGKTRLLGQLAERAAERRHAVFVGRGAELERELPFAIWVDALDDHVGTLGERKLEALIGERVAELARVLPSAAPAGAAAGGLQDERFHAYRAVRALLQRMAMGHPVVLMLDDVHWADDASLELIAHLLRRPPPAPVLIALAFRAGQVPNCPAGRARPGEPRRDGERDRARAALGGGGRRPARHAGAAAPSTARAAATRSTSRSSRGRRRRPRASRARRRARRRAAGRGRRARPGDRRAAGAGAAARLGRRGGGRAVRPRPRRRRRRAWTSARRWPAIDQLLAANIAGPTEVPRRYRFRHPLVRRAVYDGAGEAWRLEAHARAAAALADRPGALATRAHHVERSAKVGDEAAAAVLEQAGHQAAARAPAIAARWFEAALRLLGGDAAAATGGHAPPAPDGAAVDPGRRLGLLVPLAGALAATGPARARARDAGGGAGAGRAARPAGPADRRLRGVREPARPPRRRPRPAAGRARGARRPGRRGGRRAARRAGRRRALRQRLRGDADVGHARRRHGAAARGPRARGARHRPAVLRRVQPRRPGGGRGGAHALRRADRRAARRPADAAARRAVLLRLRGVLLRALRRRDPPPAARDQPLARDRPGPVRGADDGRARARAGDARVPGRGGRDGRRRGRGGTAGRQPPARRLRAGRQRAGRRRRSATPSGRARPATRRSRCSTASTTACSRAPRTRTWA